MKALLPVKFVAIINYNHFIILGYPSPNLAWFVYCQNLKEIHTRKSKQEKSKENAHPGVGYKDATCTCT